MPRPDLPYEPSYLRLGPAEIRDRAEQALTLLGPERCEVCPRLCRVDRLDDETGLCGIGRRAVVASAFAHFGEEDCLRGRNGSGTIFFSGCNLRCTFCQNWDISWEVRGDRATPERLAEMMLGLQRQGCHNINLVTPEHVVPQVLEALPAAIEGGLRLPIVYNTSAYDSLDGLGLLDGVVDVYMPDFKVVSRDVARRYLRRADYAEVATAALREMHRQVGPLRFDVDGLAVRGLLVRHLVMPGLPEETEAVLRFVVEELGPDTYVDVMAQYYPAGLVGRADRRDNYGEIDRRLRRDEHERAVEFARATGLRRLDPRSVAAGERLARS
jgi:putative pyruvate formate lyase activating enzyme